MFVRCGKVNEVRSAAHVKLEVSPLEDAEMSGGS